MRQIERIVVPILVIFMAAFVLQRASSLAGHDRAGHRRKIDYHGRVMPISATLSPTGTVRAGITGAPPPVPALAQPVLGRVLFAPSLPAGEALVSNDYASFNPHARGARLSPEWLVTSGSLFSIDGVGWTGIPDSRSTNATSSNGTGSSTFRVLVKHHEYTNVAVSFDLLLQRFVSTRANPVHSWDGVHLFLHYENQRSLYVVTLNRRDGRDLVKKKRPGGPANGGTYYTLGRPALYRPPLGRWQHVLVTISSSLHRHSVTIVAYVNNRRLLATTDHGLGGPVLRNGAVGLRGDNAEFEFAHFQVRALQ